MHQFFRQTGLDQIVADIVNHLFRATKKDFIGIRYIYKCAGQHPHFLIIKTTVKQLDISFFFGRIKNANQKCQKTSNNVLLVLHCKVRATCTAPHRGAVSHFVRYVHAVRAPEDARRCAARRVAVHHTGPRTRSVGARGLRLYHTRTVES